MEDAEFNRQFRHGFADVAGVRMHYVTGGTGDALVLLHGWPQSWYEWRGMMPALAERFTVYAVDLPGLGDSEGAPPSYAKATLARYVHGLIADHLGLHSIRLVAHDLGAGVGFQYAAQYPDEVTKYAHLDYPLPGPCLSAAEYQKLSWHIAFHGQRKSPEALVATDVRGYLAHFYPQVAHGGESFGGPGVTSPFPDQQIDEFARTYSPTASPDRRVRAVPHAWSRRTRQHLRGADSGTDDADDRTGHAAVRPFDDHPADVRHHPIPRSTRIGSLAAGGEPKLRHQGTPSFPRAMKPVGGAEVSVVGWGG